MSPGTRSCWVFIHPVVWAIALRFRLAYDHLFCDGNGRTARGLFCWAMLHQGYWLFEFISISSVINRARGQYERSFLLSESDDNDLTYVLLAQVGVIQQAIASWPCFAMPWGIHASATRCSPIRTVMG